MNKTAKSYKKMIEHKRSVIKFHESQVEKLHKELVDLNKEKLQKEGKSISWGKFCSGCCFSVIEELDNIVLNQYWNQCELADIIIRDFKKLWPDYSFWHYQTVEIVKDVFFQMNDDQIRFFVNKKNLKSLLDFIEKENLKINIEEIENEINEKEESLKYANRKLSMFGGIKNE